MVAGSFVFRDNARRTRVPEVVPLGHSHTLPVKLATASARPKNKVSINSGSEHLTTHSPIACRAGETISIKGRKPVLLVLVPRQYCQNIAKSD
jgi:hypothetical protein